MKKNFFLSLILFNIMLISLIVWLDQKSIGVHPLSVGLTADEIAVNYVKETESDEFTIDRNTVEAVQQVEMDGLVLVLVQYRGYKVDGEMELCEIVVKTEKKLFNLWKAKSCAGLCHELDDPLSSVPITIVTNMGNSILYKHGYSAAYGYLRNALITKVVITWEDDQIQQAVLQGSTYLAVREGGFFIKKMEVFNDHNELMYMSKFGSVQDDSYR